MSLLAKLNWLLTRREKALAAGLLALMAVGAAFEALSVAAIAPFAALLNDPARASSSGGLRWLSEATGAGTARQMLLWVGAALLLTYAVKAAYLAWLYQLQYRFIFNRQVIWSQRLLRAYVRSPYPFHLQRNSAELLRNIDTEVAWICSGILVPGATVAIESLVVAVILIVLIAVDPWSAAGALAVLGLGSLLFYRIIRRYAARLGERQQRRHAEMIQGVQEALGAVKEAAVLGRQEHFVERFTRSAREYTQAMRALRTMNDLPRLAIELLTVGGLLALVMASLARGRELSQLLPLVGVFGVAATRLMPSFNRIVNGMTLLRYYAPSVHAVCDDLQATEAAAADAAGASDSRAAGWSRLARGVTLDGVSYRYPGAAVQALEEVTCEIPKGASIAFVGPSGAGKTTLVDVLLGLLTPDDGRVLIDGQDLRSMRQAWQRRIGYIPQQIYLCDDTLRRNVAFGVPDAAIDDARVHAALEAAQLTTFIQALPQGLDTRTGEHGVRMSAGQRQRIGIARALYHDPDVLVMDEATSALDYATELAVVQAVHAQRGRRTVITIAHRLSTVKNCDQLHFLRAGRLQASGTYEELLATQEEFQQMAAAGAAVSDGAERARP